MIITPDLVVERLRIMKDALWCWAFDEKRIRVGGREVIITDISKSHLLRLIAMRGYTAFEGEVVRLLENYPWHIDRFIDAGANVGFYSMLASIFFDNSVKVTAIEPFPANVEYINKLKRLNGLEFEVIDKALDRSGGRKVALYYPVKAGNSRLPASASLINSFKGTGGLYNKSPYKTIEVETVTLPEIAGDGGGDILIKLDCEGSEMKIIESSSSILKRPNVDLIIEMMINDKDKNDIYALLKGAGYDAYLMTNSGFVREDRPLTFPKPHISKRTLWKNHFFTKRPAGAIKEVSLKLYGFYI